MTRRAKQSVRSLCNNWIFRRQNIREEKLLFGLDSVSKVKKINFYLKAGDVLFIENRTNQFLSKTSKITKGSQPTDGGNLIIQSDEIKEFIKKEPESEKAYKKIDWCSRIYAKINLDTVFG